MKLSNRERMFSGFDSFDICDEGGNVLCTVKDGCFLDHCLKIFDSRGIEAGIVKGRTSSYLPKFELYKVFPDNLMGNQVE